QFAYFTCDTKAALPGHEYFNSLTFTSIFAVETHSAALKIKPVACSTRTLSGSPVTGFLIGSRATFMRLPICTLLLRPLMLNLNGTYCGSRIFEKVVTIISNGNPPALPLQI